MVNHGVQSKKSFNGLDRMILGILFRRRNRGKGSLETIHYLVVVIHSNLTLSTCTASIIIIIIKEGLFLLSY